MAINKICLSVETYMFIICQALRSDAGIGEAVIGVLMEFLGN